MTRTKVVCCSCFIDKCVYFCETKPNFEDLTYNNFYFIKETREHCVLNGPLIYTEHVMLASIVFCFNCGVYLFKIFEFLTLLLADLHIVIRLITVRNLMMTFLLDITNFLVKVHF